jgi:hypothetical protein
MRFDARRAGGWAALLAGLGALGVAAFVARPGQVPADAGTVPAARPVSAASPVPTSPVPVGPAPSTAGPGRRARSIPSASSTSPVVGWTPQRLVISRLGVAAAVDAVGVQRGALDIPENPAQVGWWVGSAVPGDARGTVLIAGHVDTARAGKGALFQLERLPIGATVDVRAGDRTFVYRTVARRSYPKQRLPDALFARTGPAQLVLITCGGAFRNGAYDHNVVVYASPVDAG